MPDRLDLEINRTFMGGETKPIVLTSGVYPNLEDRHGQDGSGQYCTYTCLAAWVWTWMWAWALPSASYTRAFDIRTL
jgi:hypothetical protein